MVDEDILIAHTRYEVHEIDTNTGNILKSYTGVQAHGITLSLDGNFIFYASQEKHGSMPLQFSNRQYSCDPRGDSKSIKRIAESVGKILTV